MKEGRWAMTHEEKLAALEREKKIRNLEASLRMQDGVIGDLKMKLAWEKDKKDPTFEEVLDRRIRKVVEEIRDEYRDNSWLE